MEVFQSWNGRMKCQVCFGAVGCLTQTQGTMQVLTPSPPFSTVLASISCSALTDKDCSSTKLQTQRSGGMYCGNKTRVRMLFRYQSGISHTGASQWRWPLPTKITAGWTDRNVARQLSQAKMGFKLDRKGWKEAKLRGNSGQMSGAAHVKTGGT